MSEISTVVDPIEQKVRSFLIDDMMKDSVKGADLDSELDLDSLDQTELRVFLDEEFGIKSLNVASDQPFNTIGRIVALIKQ